jgi:hypothetical protein
MLNRWAVALVAAIIAVSAVPTGSASAQAGAASHASSAEGSRAMPIFTQVSLSMLSALPVAPEYTAARYNRDAFGGWIDADRDGCNTRKEVLLSESSAPTEINGRCTVTSGEWTSTFDGKTTQVASNFDVDHMVPLKEAWISGAYQWSSLSLQQFSNDLGYEHSLIAVTASSNRKKSDNDPASWLPSDASFYCQYIGRWIGVKYRWGLTVDETEKSVLTMGVQTCGTDANVAMPEVMAVTFKTEVTDEVVSAADRAGEQRFANCSALNAVYEGGVAAAPGTVNMASGRVKPTRYPVSVDAAVYAAHTKLDRDKDGIACER